MTNKEIKKYLISKMKKDIELKKHAKEIDELNEKQFKNLISLFKIVNEGGGL